MPIEALVKEATGLPDKYVDMVVSYIHFLQYQNLQERQTDTAIAYYNHEGQSIKKNKKQLFMKSAGKIQIDSDAVNNLREGSMI